MSNYELIIHKPSFALHFCDFYDNRSLIGNVCRQQSADFIMTLHNARSSRSGKFSSFSKFKRSESVTKAVSLLNSDITPIYSSGYIDHDSYRVPTAADYQEVPETVSPSLGHVVHQEMIVSAVTPGPDEFVSSPKSKLQDWKEGRRVVDLQVLASQLEHCVQCSAPLRLSQCVGEVRMGLGGWLHIICDNSVCKRTNKVSLGTRHGPNQRIWDINTKLSTGMLHSGLGERQVNNLLTALNILPVSSKTLKSRERESGGAIEDVAECCVREAVAEEMEATANRMNTYSGHVPLSASVDGGWQSRGSGRNYNSLSGHVTMIGVETGKVIGFDVRSKSCKQCQKKSEKDHDCRRNWSGSSKAMEADMVVNILKQQIEEEITVKTLVGDDDSAAISRVHKEVDGDVCKLSDSNHIQKKLSNSLYELKKSFNQLSVLVIKYLLRNFTYMCKQNKGKPDLISASLEALSRHPFGDHASCSPSWCGYLQDPDGYRFKTLPHKRPLTDLGLQQRLRDVFASFQPHVDKLANMSSSQANESMNNSIASKAPKTKCYSMSSSLNFRVGASVAQKNIGYSYLTAVNKKLSLSPGKLTLTRAKQLDRHTKRLRSKCRSIQGKRSRLQLKILKSSKQGGVEVREGTTYSSNMTLSAGEEDIEGIRGHTPQPVSTPVDSTTSCQVFFDIETTGFGTDAHITQIAATCRGETFNTYVLPRRAISKQASDVTGLTCDGQQMFKHYKPVPAVPIKIVLKSFLEFLKRFNKCILCGHNAKTFDSRVFVNSIKRCDMLNDYATNLTGFIDTLPLFKEMFPEKSCYKQDFLCKDILNMTYEAHNAASDVYALQELVHHIPDVSDHISRHSFSLQNVNNVIEHLCKKKLVLSTLACLKGTVSPGMLERIASSGLQYQHLQLAVKRGGFDGLVSLFGDEWGGKPRITKSKNIVQKVFDFFSQK